MEIVVTHLTRMRAPRICVAGLDIDTDAQIRPVKRHGRLDIDDLLENGGVFAVGEHVDLGPVIDVGSPPEVEDREYRGATSRGQLSAEDFWNDLERTAASTLEEIFGEDLVPDAPGRTIAFWAWAGITRSPTTGVDAASLHQPGQPASHGVERCRRRDESVCDRSSVVQR